MALTSREDGSSPARTWALSRGSPLLGMDQASDQARNDEEHTEVLSLSPRTSPSSLSLRASPSEVSVPPAPTAPRLSDTLDTLLLHFIQLFWLLSAWNVS